MKILTGGFFPWSRCSLTLLGSLSGGANDQNSDRQKKMALIAVSVIIVSLGSLFFTMYDWSPQMSQALYIGLGEALADETVKAIGPHGTVVPILARAHMEGNMAPAVEWKTFAKEIKKHRNVKLAEPILVNLEETTGEPAITRADFDNLVDQHATAGALVFLVGLPAWDAKSPVTLPSVAPKIIAVHHSPLSAKPYLASSVVTLLIAARIDPVATATREPTTPRASFDRYFQIFTAQNYQSLPDYQ